MKKLRNIIINYLIRRKQRRCKHTKFVQDIQITTIECVDCSLRSHIIHKTDLYKKEKYEKKMIRLKLNIP